MRFRVTTVYHMTLALVCLSLALMLTHAQGAENNGREFKIGAHNVRDMTDAQNTAQTIIDAVKGDPSMPGGSSNNPLIAIHYGDVMPAATKWIMVQLQKNHVYFQVVQVRRDDMRQALSDAEASTGEFVASLTYQNKIPVTEAENASQGIRRVYANLKHTLADNLDEAKDPLRLLSNTNVSMQEFIGLPGYEATLWVRVPTTKEIEKLDHAKAVSSAKWGVATLGLSFVITYMAGVPVHDWFAQTSVADIARSAASLAALGGWVYINMFKFRSVHETMTQGKTMRFRYSPEELAHRRHVMKEAFQDFKSGNLSAARDKFRALQNEPAPKGKWAIEATNTFLWPMNFLRGFVSNLVIFLPKWGFESTFSSVRLSRNVDNSVGNMFARSRIDRWVADKTPTTKDSNGNVIVLEGQWTQEGAAQTNFLWQTIYPLAKNLQALGAGVIADVGYKALAAFNLAWMALDMRNDFIEAVDVVGTKYKLDRCETLLMSSRQAKAHGLIE